MTGDTKNDGCEPAALDPDYVKSEISKGGLVLDLVITSRRGNWAGAVVVPAAELEMSKDPSDPIAEALHRLTLAAEVG